MTAAAIDVVQLDDRTLLGVMFGMGDLTLVDHLLKTFGGMAGVLGASGARLKAEARRRGIRLPVEAVRMDAVREATARCLRARVHARHRITSRSQLYAYLRVTLGALGREQMRVLYLDQDGGLIAEEGTLGSVDHAPFYPREVLRRALELEASKLILAHNHPSRSATSSPARKGSARAR